MIVFVYRDSSQYNYILYEINDVKKKKNRWLASYSFVIQIILLKGLFPHSNISEFHLLSYLTSPFNSPRSSLYLVEVFTGHVGLWTRVRIQTCPMEISTGHKPCPIPPYREGSLEQRFLEDNSYKLYCGIDDFIIILWY